VNQQTCYAYLSGAAYRLMIAGQCAGVYPGQPEAEAAAIARGYRVQAWRRPDRAADDDAPERKGVQLAEFMIEHAGEWITTAELALALNISRNNLRYRIKNIVVPPGWQFLRECAIGGHEPARYCMGRIAE